MDPIYCIRAALGSEGRYIGVTCLLPEERLQDHLSEARRGGKNHRLNWFRSLSEPPIIEVIEWVLPSDRVEREMYWIALFRDYGHSLVNGTPGGEGLGSGPANPNWGKRGHKHTPEWRVRASLRLRGAGSHRFGKTNTAEHRQKLIAANTGRVKSPEERGKISAAAKRRTQSSETRAKIGAALLGKKRGPYKKATI